MFLTSLNSPFRIFTLLHHLQVQKLKESLAKYPQGTGQVPYTSSSADKDQENISTLVSQSAEKELKKSRISDTMERAVNELIKMANSGEPLWIKSVETGREILNYDEYVKEFPLDQSANNRGSKRSIEVSRDTGVAFVDLPKLVQCFMDAVLGFSSSTFL